MTPDNLGFEEPASEKDAVRAFSMRAGSVPKLERGQRVWVLNGPFWMTATVGARLPGNVYRGRIDGMGRREGYVIICTNVYGGLVK